MATYKMPAINPMPAMPSRGKKAATPRACTCGCGGMTKGGRYIPGHDARHHGWAIRISRGFSIEGITPGEERAARAFLAAGHWPNLTPPAAPKRREPKAVKPTAAEVDAAIETFKEEAAQG